MLAHTLAAKILWLQAVGTASDLIKMEIMKGYGVVSGMEGQDQGQLQDRAPWSDDPWAQVLERSPVLVSYLRISQEKTQPHVHPLARAP